MTTSAWIHISELKLEVCRQIIQEAKQPAQAYREHELLANLPTRWCKEYDQRGKVAFTLDRTLNWLA